MPAVFAEFMLSFKNVNRRFHEREFKRSEKW